MSERDFDPQGALERALIASAAKAGCPIEILDDDFTRWSSALYRGGKHLLHIASARSLAFDNWVGNLGDLELPIVGYVLTSAVIAARHRAGDYVDVRVELMTVETAAAA